MPTYTHTYIYMLIIYIYTYRVYTIVYIYIYSIYITKELKLRLTRKSSKVHKRTGIIYILKITPKYLKLCSHVKNYSNKRFNNIRTTKSELKTRRQYLRARRTPPPPLPPLPPPGPALPPSGRRTIIAERWTLFNSIASTWLPLSVERFAAGKTVTDGC